ncbi:MAG TPA: N-6 DNA methylase [Mycobacteriales bacterium]|nr:N-6 DNA methylase [Mycobacteriales bacterium]
MKRPDDPPPDPRRRANRIPTPPADPQRHARAIAQAVEETWHRAHGTGDVEVPVSVIAGLSLIAPDDTDTDTVAGLLLDCDTAAFTRLMRAQWSVFVHARPDLVVPAWPLLAVWHGEPGLDQPATCAARQVAHAAIRAGQLHLTGTDRRRKVDLFGPVLTALRSHTDRRARGQFYTPAEVSTLIAGLLGPPQPGQVVHEPAAGTGGMLRAVAQAMREAGRDPAEVAWVAVDTDPLAIACLAVNTVLWHLGPYVLLGVGDALTADWITRAVAQRRHTLELARHIGQARTILAALRGIHPDR